MIGIIDYGMGNLHSVKNALDFLGIENQIIANPSEIESMDKIIIPGVGSFKRAMDNLHEKNLVDPLVKFGNSGKYLLGICLGMQLLAETGTEPSVCNGLGLIPGVVELIKSETLRIPHMGWNGLIINNDHPILEGVKLGADFYFVHSYAFHVESDENIVAVTPYGYHVPAIVKNKTGNIIGIQFHPEKSQKQGLKLIENFSNL
jgi:glutamine amidotransferase